MNKYEELIKIAKIHMNRIEIATKHIRHLFPITAESVANLGENELAWIELFISRFSKLQDLIGSKLIDMFLEQKSENIDGLAMIDKLNKLEKLGVINDAEIWKEMRLLRNHISHEYPDLPELSAKYLNQIFALKDNLINIAYKLIPF